jgi:hypothetical protein
MSLCLLPPDAPEHWCDIRRRTVQVPNPAAGADWSVQVPGAEAWSIRSLAALLTASAIVASRGPQLQVIHAGVVIAVFQPSQSITAGSASQVGLVPGGPAAANQFAGMIEWGVPDPFIVWPGLTLAVATRNIDVADQWSGIALDVVFELNRGRGAARRYAEWAKATEAGLPADRVRSGPAGG